MRTFDFAPFYRSTVGFDRMFSMLDELGGVDGSAPSYPPYNIERNGENAFRISVAVLDSPTLTIDRSEGNTLTIRGEKQAKANARAKWANLNSKPTRGQSGTPVT